MRSSPENHVRWFILVLLIAVVALVVLVMWQFWAPIVLAILLAMLATPAFRWLMTKGLRPSIGAILVVIGSFLIVVIPVLGLIFGPLIISIAIVVVEIYRDEYTTPN